MHRGIGHSIIWQTAPSCPPSCERQRYTPGEVFHRAVSCFCSYPKVCGCFKFTKVTMTTDSPAQEMTTYPVLLGWRCWKWPRRVGSGKDHHCEIWIEAICGPSVKNAGRGNTGKLYCPTWEEECLQVACKEDSIYYSEWNSWYNFRAWALLSSCKTNQTGLAHVQHISLPFHLHPTYNNFYILFWILSLTICHYGLIICSISDASRMANLSCCCYKIIQ